MRIALMAAAALIALAGCAGAPPEELILVQPPQPPDEQARQICTARGQMVGAAPSPATALPGAIMEGSSVQQFGDRVAAACWSTYQATRILPSY